eukprot:CAMPEP_0174306048 /NCGR_PEP_ID=MMETSP0810-20121108/196_1 /TAXON_ID=73025 ORGANISM="Eutreptiella gymnastica-like, Strain CCMP1594" /NCGR_SAMPLE_ID=MMETSP0810 /ASSEMBLY_ACC=CAM_ASM_000659 /LENGTH=38 /DNA_ID= /DNA_START= /DNA_END= /DNA_ORIENTATION=
MGQTHDGVLAVHNSLAPLWTAWYLGHACAPSGSRCTMP